MQLTVTGKQVDVGEALRRHVEASLDSLLGKYFRTAIEAHAVFTREAHLSSHRSVAAYRPRHHRQERGGSDGLLSGLRRGGRTPGQAAAAVQAAIARLPRQAA